MQLIGYSTRPSRVLIVDDNPTNLLLLSRALQKAGYAVLQARTGPEAIEEARRDSPDLILLDVMLPGMDGLQVCRTLKDEPSTAGIPILFVTARTDSDEIVQALSLGGSDYITKPFIIGEVLARVSVHLRLRRTEQELTRRNSELEKLSHDLSEMNLELARLTRSDPLTGLLNRRAWHEAAALEQHRSQRKGAPYAVIMIDIDYFKRLNDTLGHQAGDECLVRIAASIQAACRTIDLVGRYGGEEVVVLAPETDEEGAAHVAERVRTAMDETAMPHPASDVADHVTVSIGVAAATFKEWELVVRDADLALYAAKHGGRNRVCRYSEIASDAGRVDNTDVKGDA